MFWENVSRLLALIEAKLAFVRAIIGIGYNPHTARRSNRVPRAAPLPRGEVMPMDVSEVVAFLERCVNLALAIVRFVREVRRKSSEHESRQR